MTDCAVVTGPSRGIGRAVALALGARGLRVALLGRRSARLDAVARELCDGGIEALAAPCDVAVEADVGEAARAVVERWGAPAVVVNNAGTIVRGPKVHETTLQSWDAVLGVNLRGAFLVARAFLPAMLARGRGRLVQIASVSATLGSPGAASYGASKWALVGLTKSLAEELRGTGVSAIAVSPGSVDTDMLVGSGFPAQMTAADVARTVVFAALDAPDALTGSAIEMFG